MIPLGPGTLVGQRRSGWVRQAPRVELRLESAAPRIFSGGPADTRDRVFEISGIGSFAAIRAVPRTGPGSGPANAATPNITPSSPRSATLRPKTDSRGLPGPRTERYAVATRSRLPEHGLYNRAIAGRPGVHVGTLKLAPKAVGDAATDQTCPRPVFGGCRHTGAPPSLGGGCAGRLSSSQPRSTSGCRQRGDTTLMGAKSTMSPAR